MNRDHVHFADWDAAYLVGALSPADRRQYEEHLDECRVCREALAELAPTLGLLSRVSPDRAESLLEPADDAASAAPGPDARSDFVVRAAREARRRRALGWGGAVAAAAAAVVVIVLAVTSTVLPPSRSQVVALEPVADVSLSATVALSEVAWGTRLEMVCRYPDGAGADVPPEGWSYVLVVTAEDGTTSELSTWRARPGSTTRLDAGTALDADDIAAIEVRSLDGERVLLRGELPSGR